MKKTIRNIFLLGLGAVAILNKDKIKKELDKLVEQGKIKSEEAKKIAQDLIKEGKIKQKDLNKRIDTEVQKQVNKLGYVSGKVHDKIVDRNKKLEAEIKKLKAESRASKAKIVQKKAKKAVKKAVSKV